MTWYKFYILINNGCTSIYFELQRGVRQGDPLSALLFILAMEVLTVSINHNAAITGLTINHNELKVVQYADDLTGILKDKLSLNALLQEMKRYSDVSGLYTPISLEEDFATMAQIVFKS